VIREKQAAPQEVEDFIVAKLAHYRLAMAS
jgi:hypothetical protein